MKKFKEWDKKKKIICLVVVLLIVIVAGLVAYKSLSHKTDVTDTTEVTHVKAKKTKKCPIDFQAYWDVNPEVVAYVEVPDTDVSYPILRRADDAAYYADHQIDGTQGLPGSIYIEPINSGEFTDTNTIVYGHNMKNGTMFHTLHNFEDADFFAQDHEFYIYTPEHRYTYKVFAAGCIVDEHLMAKYNFSTNQGNIDFAIDLQKLDNSYSHYKEGTEITNDTKLCTLFTCMPSGMEDNRFVVVGYLTDTLDYED